MTGRELIIYILENNLEDEVLITKDRISSLLFMTDKEAAVKFGVGVETVQLWHKLGMLESTHAGETLLILGNSKNPRKE